MTAPRPCQAWGAGVLIASIALLGIVVVAAEGRPLEGPTSSARLDVGTAWRDALIAAFAFALVAGAVLVVWSLLAPRRRAAPAPRKRRHQWLVTAVALLLTFVAYLALRPNLDDDDDATAAGDPPAASDERGASPSSPPPWAVLALGGVVAAALAGVGPGGTTARAARWSSTRPRRRSPPRGPRRLDRGPRARGRPSIGGHRGLRQAARRLRALWPRTPPVGDAARAPPTGPGRVAVAPRAGRAPDPPLPRSALLPAPIGPAERDEAHAALMTARRDLAVTATAG